MKFKVTFTDIFEDCEDEEQVYEALLDYLYDIVQHEDLTAFEIQKLNEEN